MKKELIEQLYIEYGNALRLYIYSICCDLGLAEELTQETFVKALLSLDSKHANLKAWLFKVGKNLTINRLKKDKKILLTDEVEDVLTTEDIPEELISNEKNKELYEAILKLPQMVKQVLVLKYFSNLSFARIGEVLGTSPGNARNIAYKARKQLRKELEDKQ